MVKLLDTLVYILFYGLPVYVFLDVYTLPYDTQWKIILTIILTIFQFVRLEERIDKLKIKFYENKNVRNEKNRETN
jgi:hypothetical protein